jgi:N-acyl homoserine lactone hydrolase
MAEWTIRPIRMGVVQGSDKSGLTHGMNQGVMIDTCVIVYVIENGSESIIVDTGMGDSDWSEKYHHKQVQDYQDLTTGLQKIGVNPDNVRTVVCTHLHWDHCFNNDLFKNAKILVQKDEIRYAIAPLPLHALFYESQLIGMRPPWLKAMERIELIEGDKEVAPGIDIVKIPSHSPGFQGVNVKTRKGNYFIASDFCPLFENWEGAGFHRHIISPIHVNLDDYYRSFEKVEKIADVVLPGHDVKVFERECYP